VPNILDFFRDRKTIDVITEAAGDPRTVPGELFFLNRTPVLPATDRELGMRWRGSAVVADMIAMDARSNVYKMLQARTFQAEIPKIKVGTYLAESDVREVLMIGQAQIDAGRPVPEFVRNLFRILVQQLVLSRRWRLEIFLVASELNGISYDRMGMKISASFSKDPLLIATLSPAWTDAVNGKPLTNIRYFMDLARIRFNLNINRMICSRALFDTMTATNEFKTESQSALLSLFDLTAMPSLIDRTDQINAFKRRTKIEEVVLYDAHFRWEDDAERRYLQRVLPLNACILDSTANDNNEMVRYLGNAPVTETAFAGLTGHREIAEGGDLGLGGMRPGPYYYTHVPHDLDPPQIQAKVVQNAWPILREPNHSVVLYVGNIVETIPVSDVF
jgi:hypothetical protein